MRIIANRFYSILIVVVMLLASLYFIASTQTGARWTLNIVAKFVPGKLTFDGIHGKLEGTLNIDKLSYQKDQTKITAKNINLTWKPKDLFFGALVINKLNANNIIIQLPPLIGTDAKKSLVIPKILKGHFPLELQLQNIKLDHIVISHQDLPKTAIIDILTLELHTNHRYIKSADLELHASNAALQIHGQLHKNYNLSWNININQLGNLLPEATGSIISHGQITGTKKSPKVNATIQGMNLSFDGNKIKNLQSNINLDLTRNQTSQVNFIGSQMNFQQYAIDQIALKAQITPTQQQTHRIININAQLGPTTISLPTEYQIYKLILQGGRLRATIADKKANIALTNITASIPALNLNLKNIQINATGDTHELDYMASLASGTGNLNIKGKTALGKPKLASEISISGKNFLASNTDTLQIYASPNLKLLLNTDRFDAEGTITLPKTNIQPRDFSSVKTLSNDVVFVGKKRQKIFIKKTAFEIHYNVKLILGDQVKVNAFNLDGRLTGQLQINKQPQGTMATGSFFIKDGNYTVYGQPLAVKSGSLTFSDSPINNPLIDITAVRDFKPTGETTVFEGGAGTLTVGVRVQGPLNHLRTSFFSTPTALSNEDILSYLMLGQASSQVGEDKLSLILRAAQALNFGGSGNIAHITNSIRQKLGLAELGVETEPTFESSDKGTTSKTSAVVGKYLAPSLYIGYSYSFLDQENIFKVRYKLWKGLYIQTEGGTGNTQQLGGDLLYSFGRK